MISEQPEIILGCLLFNDDELVISYTAVTVLNFCWIGMCFFVKNKLWWALALSGVRLLANKYRCCHTKTTLIFDTNFRPQLSHVLLRGRFSERTWLFSILPFRLLLATTAVKFCNESIAPTLVSRVFWRPLLGAGKFVIGMKPDFQLVDFRLRNY